MCFPSEPADQGLGPGSDGNAQAWADGETTILTAEDAGAPCIPLTVAVSPGGARVRAGRLARGTCSLTKARALRRAAQGSGSRDAPTQSAWMRPLHALHPGPGSWAVRSSAKWAQDRAIHSVPRNAGKGQPGLRSEPCRPLCPGRPPPLPAIVRVFAQTHTFNEASLREHTGHAPQFTPKSAEGTSRGGCETLAAPPQPHPRTWESAFVPFLLWLFFLASAPVRFQKQ